MALVLALVLAILYFGLIELLLIDSARELGEARRFRARIVAETLAENGVELAALQILSRDTASVAATDWQGAATAQMKKNASTGSFEIRSTGVTSGITESKATVVVTGQVSGTIVNIDYTVHSY